MIEYQSSVLDSTNSLKLGNYLTIIIANNTKSLHSSRSIN